MNEVVFPYPPTPVEYDSLRPQSQAIRRVDEVLLTDVYDFIADIIDQHDATFWKVLK